MENTVEKTRNNLLIYGTDEGPNYHCPWHSILLIGYRVIHRWDEVTDDRGLLETQKLLTNIFNGIKLQYMQSRPQYKLADAAKAIDPTSVPYHGWYAEAHMKYTNEHGRLSRPFAQGFVVATRRIPRTSLVALSIGIVANIGAYLERERLLGDMMQQNQDAGLYDDGPIYDEQQVMSEEEILEAACRQYRADFDEQSEYVQDKIRGLATDWYKIFKQ